MNEFTDVDTFPLGKTGGLIEARGNPHPSGRPLGRCFRWVKPAASLKPVHDASVDAVDEVSAG